MASLKNKLLEFRNQRNWQQFHTPANLSKSIVIEAAELLENFQWHGDNYDLEAVKQELADIYIYLLLLSHDLGLDLEEIATEKMKINEANYPVDLSKNNATKYTKLKDSTDDIS